MDLEPRKWNLCLWLVCDWCRYKLGNFYHLKTVGWYRRNITFETFRMRLINVYTVGKVEIARNSVNKPQFMICKHRRRAKVSFSRNECNDDRVWNIFIKAKLKRFASLPLLALFLGKKAKKKFYFYYIKMMMLMVMTSTYFSFHLL